MYNDVNGPEIVEDLLEICRGRVFKEYWAVDLPDGTTLDPTDGTVLYASLTVKDRHDGTELVQLNTDNGGIILQYTEEPDNDGNPSGVFWSGYSYMTAVATGQLVDWGMAVWDMYVTWDNGEKETLYAGQAVLRKEVGS